MQAYLSGQSLLGQSGQPLLQAAKALTQLTYGAPISELAHQIAVNNRQGQGAQKLTSGYYTRLGKFGEQSVADERNIASGLNTQLSNIGQGLGANLQSIGDQAQQAYKTYTPGLGTATSPGSQALAGAIAQQRGIGALGSAGFQQYGATQGANYRGLAAANLGAYNLAGQESLRQIAQGTTLANEPLNTKIASLVSQIPEALTKNLGGLRQQEITNAITQQGLGLKQQALNQQIKYQNAQTRIAADRINVTIRGQNVTMSHDQAMERIASINSQLAAGRLSETQRHNLAEEKIQLTRAVGGGGAGAARLPKYTPTGQPTLTPYEQNKLFSEVDRLPSLIRAMQQPLGAAVAKQLGLPAGTKLSEGQIRNLLAAGPNPAHTTFDPKLVDAGYALAGWGYLTPRQIIELNKMGLIVGSRYKRGPAATSAPSGHGGVGHNMGY
jgi:hypothetical protein